VKFLPRPGGNGAPMGIATSSEGLRHSSVGVCLESCIGSMKVPCDERW
jgi:hypothetical protein